MDILAVFPLFRPLLIALSGAGLAYFIVQAIPVQRFDRNRLGAFASANTITQATIGSEAHRVRLAFAKWGLDVTGYEMTAWWGARIGAATLTFLLTFMVGLPLLMGLALGAIAWLALDGLLQDAWRSLVTAIEKEVPTFLSRLAGTIQVESNVLNAVTEVGETLPDKSPLRAWLERLVGACRTRGPAGLKDMQTEAQVISSSLGLAVFEIGRLWETGGQGYGRAFSLAADNLADILQARGQAEAKGDGARGSIRLVLLSLGGVMVYMIQQPNLTPYMQLPIVQLIYVGIGLWVAFGWRTINDMIEDAI